MSITQFRSSQFVVRAYHPSRIRQKSMRSQINCLGATRSSMFSHASLPLKLMSSRNMKNHRPLRANISDFLDQAYYSLLGLSEDSTLSDLKKAYRRLAMKYHPDVNKEEDPEAAAKFIEITNAYEVLLDGMKEEALEDICEEEVMIPIKRTCYDWYSLKTLMAKCTTCAGQGHVYTSVKTPLGMKQQALTCSSCNGTGNVFDLRTSDIS